MAALATETPLDTATRNQHKLLRFMHITDDEYAKLPVADRRAKVADVLGIDKKYIAASVPVTVDGLRPLFAHEWIAFQNVHFTKDLLGGHVTCIYCTGLTSNSGHVTLAATPLNNHGQMVTASGAESKHAAQLKAHKHAAASAILRATARQADSASGSAVATGAGSVGASSAGAGSVSSAGSAGGADSADNAAAGGAGAGAGGLSALRQANLGAFGFSLLSSSKSQRPDLTPTMMVTALAVAGGVPYTAVPALYSKQVIDLMTASSTGAHQSRALREITLPATRAAVLDHISADLSSGVPISVSVDGGSARNLIGGKKLLVVGISGAGLKCDVIIDIACLGGKHENTESQAKVVNDALLRVGASTAQARFLIADNAAVNKASVKYLNSHYGWKLEYRRCLPHCLNLIMVALLQPFDTEYGISSFLKASRGFYNAGGAAGRKIDLLERGVSLGMLDFVETRWASFLKAIAYLVSKQDDLALARARVSIKDSLRHDEAALALAEASDRKEAKECIDSLKADIKATKVALADIDEPDLVWNALYEATEDIKIKKAPVNKTTEVKYTNTACSNCGQLCHMPLLIHVIISNPFPIKTHCSLSRLKITPIGCWTSSQTRASLPHAYFYLMSLMASMAFSSSYKADRPL